MNKKILLIGASGGIGSCIYKTIRNNNNFIVKPTSKDLNLNYKINFASSLKFDALVYCAGINNPTKFSETEYDDFNSSININVYGLIQLCKKVQFTNGANIIAIGSLYSFSSNYNRIHYITSKHALLGAVKSLALEFSDRKIKVNMISPGYVDTKLTRKNLSPSEIKILDEKIPLGLTSNKSIANFTEYLINYNKDITGQNIIIDGGLSLF